MVDRPARDAMADAIRAYCNDKISAFEFDEQIHGITCTSSDATVKIIRTELWGLYDDVKDHKVILEKAGWDYLQRLLLVLASEGEIVTVDHSPAHRWTHRICAVLLVTVSYLVQVALLALAPYIALAMFMIAIVIMKRLESWQPRAAAMYPFASLTEIHAVRRSVPDYRKQPFRTELGARSIRPRWMEVPLEILAHLLLAPALPLLLLTAWRDNHRHTPDTHVRLA